jgi:uncharacterized membrane protein YdjX (TVP38/TMEM64 family)
MDLHPWLDQVVPALRSPAGAVAFVPLYALWVSLLLPGVWASMLAGALYGTAWGSLIVFAGGCLGAQVAFLLGRHRLRHWARRRLATRPTLQAIERAVSREGLKLVLLTRLSPAFPFSLLNLAYGLSEVSLRDYSIGLLAILPGTVLFCGLGELAGDASRFGAVLAGGKGPAGQALTLLGIAATLAAMVVAGRATQRALQRHTPP